jgi:hypothetical protein
MMAFQKARLAADRAVAPARALGQIDVRLEADGVAMAAALEGSSHARAPTECPPTGASFVSASGAPISPGSQIGRSVYMTVEST